jgi:hypothetical protein
MRIKSLWVKFSLKGGVCCFGKESVLGYVPLRSALKVKKGIEFHLVERFDQVLELALSDQKNHKIRHFFMRKS